MANSVIFGYAALVALLVLGLGGIAIWSRREARHRLTALFLTLFIAVVSWMIFTDLPGRFATVSVKDFRNEYLCAAVVSSETVQNKGFYLLMKKEETGPATYIFVPWNMRLARSLQKGKRFAELNKNGTVIYGGNACFSEDDEEGNGKKGKKGKRKKGNTPIKKPGGTEGNEEEGLNDEFNFYPDPVPPSPEKNYGPLYEGPLRMPERQ